MWHCSRRSWVSPTLLAAILVATVSAQNVPSREPGPKQPHYKLVDLGTLGGPISYGSADGDGGRLLNNLGNTELTENKLPAVASWEKVG
jgi:hypothetical protein